MENKPRFWPIVSASVTRTFSATHSLDIAGGCDTPHDHEYVARFGFKHEMNPNTGTVGSKPLRDWDLCCQKVIDAVSGADLNAVLAPRPPTLEMLALYMLAQLPAYFDWVELQAYEPQLTARIDRSRGAMVEWLVGDERPLSAGDLRSM